MDTLEDLISRARDGDASAFGEIVRRFQGMAVGYAQSLLGDEGEAEDAAQEAFVQAYLDLHQLREPRAFPGWFRRVLHKHCDRAFRGKRLWTVPLDRAAELVDQEPGPRARAARNQLWERVNEALRRLPDPERLVTTLFYIDGYSQAEVARFLDLPVTTVKSRLHKARGRLRERMGAMVPDVVKSGAPGGEFADRVERILQDVARIEWRTGCSCFCGATVAAMRFLGEDTSYAWIAGMSGAAFFSLWAPEEWQPDNCSVLMLGEEPVRRTFRALGRGHSWLRKSADSRLEDWRAQIVESIDAGVPVLGIGIVGPPESCVVAGYAEGGDVLLGRSYFHRESQGYFRKPDWFADCHGLIRIGTAGEKPSRAESVREALPHAIDLERQPERIGRMAGIAVYEGWASDLERDELFAEEDGDRLFRGCMCIVDDGFGTVSDARAAAAAFLREAAVEVPELNDALLQAADRYDRIARVLCAVFDKAPSQNDSRSEQRRLADPALRREMAQAAREAARIEREATELLEQAVA